MTELKSFLKPSMRAVCSAFINITVKREISPHPISQVMANRNQAADETEARGEAAVAGEGISGSFPSM